MLEAKCEQLLSAKPSCMLSLVVVVYAKKNSEVGDSVRLFHALARVCVMHFDFHSLYARVTLLKSSPHHSNSRN